MTLAELFDAIAGHNEQWQQDLEWRLWATRKQIAYACWINGAKDTREEDIFPLRMDDELRRERYANMTPIKVTTNGGE
jgi:hypothetical protein